VDGEQATFAAGGSVGLRRLDGSHVHCDQLRPRGFRVKSANSSTNTNERSEDMFIYLCLPNKQQFLQTRGINESKWKQMKQVRHRAHTPTGVGRRVA
jgi:hypothetical protein